MRTPCRHEEWSCAWGGGAVRVMGVVKVIAVDMSVPTVETAVVGCGW